MLCSVTHVEHLGAVLDGLAEVNLIVNFAKCEFAKATLTYVGKVVGQGKVRPVQAKGKGGYLSIL